MTNDPTMTDDPKIRNWCMFIHFSVFAGYIAPIIGIVVPLLLWQLKKDEDPAIDVHGRIVMNACISFFIYFAVAAILCAVVIGFLLVPIVALMAIICPIVGGIRAKDGVTWRYPLTLKLL